MPKFTLKELYEKAGSITKIANPEPKTMDIYTAFRLVDFVDAVKDKLAKSEKLRAELFKKYAVGEEIPKESIQAFSAEWEEMLGAEVVLPNLEPKIPLAKLEKIGLGPVDLGHLRFMLTNEPNAQTKE